MSVFEEIKRKIIQDIEILDPHTRLPSRGELAEQYYVSRNTIDRVVTQLCTQGYLYTIHNIGTYVSDPSLDMAIRKKLPQNTIGIILPSHGINSSYMIERGIDDYARKHQIHIVRCISGHNSEKLESYVRRLILSGVSGFLIQPPSLEASYYKVANLLKEAKIPTVFLFETFSDMQTYPLITVSNISLQALEHLYQKGYKKIAYISNQGNFTSDNNLRAFLSFIKEKGYLERQVLVEEMIEKEAFVHKVAAMLKLPKPPDAFYCFNDTVAAMAYLAIEKANLRVSVDVGVIGQDNSPVSIQLRPRLTTTDISAYDMGVQGITWINQMQKEEKSPKQWMEIVNTRLIVRESCLGKKQQ